MTTIKNISDEYGDPVQYRGRTLTLTQHAYADGTNESPVYCAAAVDADGTMYRVTWSVTNPDADDASDACDWDDYSVRLL